MSNEIPAILEPRDEEELAAEFANDQILREAQQAEADAKAAARESALAKLADLGLTEAEIAAL